ncbi:MAG: amino acid adenylation domain-containing protein, partial [Pseudonocardiaceae bacterium]
MRTSSTMTLPLTSAQTGIWLAQRFAPGLDYSISLYIEITGPLEQALLLQAARQVFDETEALRARVVEANGDLVQEIQDSAIFTMPYLDFSDRPLAREAATAWMSEDLGRRFSIETGKLYSFALLKVSDDKHFWYLRCHHAVFDGFSGALYVRRTALVYTSLIEGAGCDQGRFGALKDLVLHDSSYRESEAFRADREYWMKKLAGCSVPASFGRLDSSRAAGCTRVTSYLESSQFRDLEVLARSSGVRLPAVFVAAQFLYVARMTGETEVILGLPVTARIGKFTKNIPGMVSNVVPIRLTVDPNLALSEFLRRVFMEMRIGLRHQRYGYETLRRDLKLSEDNQPLVGPHANLQIFDYNLRFGKSTATSHNLTNGPVEDLALVIYSGTDEIPWRIDLDANSERYSPADLAIHQMCFLGLLDNMGESRSDKPIGHLDALDAAQRRQLLVDWNKTAREVPAATVPALFDAQVALTPENVAVAFQEEFLSYAQLNDRANRLAAVLLARKIGPERLVALAIPRSIEMIVALLAILKSGAAYLPIDSGHPAERIDFMLADARPALLITTSSTDRLIPDASGVPRLQLDELAVSECTPFDIVDVDRTEPFSPAPLSPAPLTPAPLTPANAAYVIYTSGSTGTPKGVVNTHAGLTNRLHWMQDRYRLEHTDRVLQKTSCNFDVSVWELLWPLVTGATLQVAEPERHKDPAYIASIIQDEQITTVHFVPSMLKAFLSEPAAGGCHSLRRVVCSGEALGAELVARFFGVLDCELHNLYGPTEASIDVTSWECAPTSDDGSAPPIGSPIANMKVFVLNKALQPVPVGVAGELYLAGVGLARGYSNRPALTAQRFVACPFGDSGTRMYRSGDLACWDEKGSLIYLGRDDDQVKVRGARVELGEIAAMLSKHDDVAEVEVIARADGSSGTRVIGYVVPDRRSMSTRLGRAQQEHVDEWRQLYQTMYGAGEATEFGEDFAGWNSSYNSKPIPLAEMAEWRAATVQRIRALRPTRILEIGVGSGLILSRLAAECESYWATDLSVVAIGKLRQQLDSRPDLVDRVELRTQAADDFGGLPVGFFDTVVLNSVVQYFPNSEYLETVLRGALDLVKPAGTVFVGDVRNLRLRRCLDTAVELEKIDGTTDSDVVRRGIELKALQENELLVDPEFFHTIGSGTGGVDIRVKRGRYDNELSRYRYDVVLHRHPARGAISLADTMRMLWRDQSGGLVELGDRLGSDRPVRLRVVGVPNERMAHEASAARALFAGRPLTDVQRELGRVGSTGEHPEAFHELGERLGYQVVVTWSGTGADGELDVLFLETISSGSSVLTDVYLASDNEKIPPNARTNNPGVARGASALSAALRDYLHRHLPEYMIPTAFVVLDHLPLTPNGKLDRHALPTPDLTPTTPTTHPPTTPQEQQLCELFAHTLHLPHIGIHDNFFDHGGDSISSIQLVSRARRIGMVFTPQDVFRCKTVARLVEVIDDAPLVVAPDTPSDDPLVTLTQEEIEQIEVVHPGFHDVWPLTPLQEGLLFHALYDERVPDIYHVQLVVDVEGPLRVERL